MGNINIKKLNEIADKLLERAFIVEDLGKQLCAVLNGENKNTLTGVMNEIREYGDDYSETIIRLYRFHSILYRFGIERNVLDSIAYYMYELWEDADIAKEMSSKLIYTMTNLSQLIKDCKDIWKESLKQEEEKQ